jgi:hypothetical protein
MVMKYKLLIFAVVAFFAISGCSLLPSMGAGARLAQDMAKHQKEFQEAILTGAISLDCATGFTIGASVNRSSNAKIDLAKQSLLSVTDTKSEVFQKCLKFGYYAAYNYAETEATVQWLLEFLGTIN